MRDTLAKYICKALPADNRENLSETEEDVLKKLKDKNLSEEDLKKLYEKIQKKK